jgi:hypothetical protein
MTPTYNCIECGKVLPSNFVNAGIPTCSDQCDARHSKKDEALRKAQREETRVPEVPKMSGFRKAARLVAEVEEDKVRMICRTELRDASGDAIKGKFVEGSGIDHNVFISELRKLLISEGAGEYHAFGKRSLLYELYNRKVVPGLSKKLFSGTYNYINKACEVGYKVDARGKVVRNGLDDDWFADESRRLSHSSGDETIIGALLGRLGIAELNHWSGQPIVPIIMCEKDGHQAILGENTSDKQVRLFTSKGTWSRPSLIKVAKTVAQLVQQGRKVIIGYVGDHDPAGIFRIERAACEGNSTGQNKSIGLKQHLNKLSVATDWKWSLNMPDALDADHNWLPTSNWYWMRIGLTSEQFKDLPAEVLGEIHDVDEEEEEVKREDGCNVEYERDLHTTARADVEALGFGGMRMVAGEFIQQYIDQPLWDASVETSNKEVEKWKRCVRGIYNRNRVTFCKYCGTRIKYKLVASSWYWKHLNSDDTTCPGCSESDPTLGYPADEEGEWWDGSNDWEKVEDNEETAE